VQTRFSKDVFEASAALDPGWKILIVDEPSMKVISAALGMYDIMENKVTMVEGLEKKRAPFPDMGAIYILSPTKESIEKLLDDYSSKSKVLYGRNVFVYFLGSIPEQYIKLIKKSRQLLKRLKALSEINVNFLVKESRAYVCDIGQPFSGYYLRNVGTPPEAILAEKLVTVCATLNEYPYIRYKQSSGICNSLAGIFKVKMDEFVYANPEWWYHGSGNSGRKSSERDRSTILLLDRANDLLTPLMHDFRYQSMIRDLLPMEGDKITTEVETEEGHDSKDVLLNEKDKLWVELRGKHIAEVIEVLSSRIRDTVKSNATAALGRGGEVTLQDLASAVKELPEYREILAKLSQHMYIARQCMDKFRRENLLELSEIEQTIATGIDDEGDSVSFSQARSRVEGSLLRMRDVEERLRMLMIATISQNGLKSSDKDKLLNAAELGRGERMTLENLSKLGISSRSSKKNRSGRKSSNGNYDLEDGEYANSRHIPEIQKVVTDLVQNSLSLDEYPSVIPMPASMTTAAGAGSARRRGGEGSARKKKPGTDKWGRTGNSSNKSAKATNFTGGRNLVFMVGGLSYNELRVCRAIMEKEAKEIIVGSTSFVSPREFLDDLSTLNG